MPRLLAILLVGTTVCRGAWIGLLVSLAGHAASSLAGTIAGYATLVLSAAGYLRVLRRGDLPWTGGYADWALAFVSWPYLATHMLVLRAEVFAAELLFGPAATLRAWSVSELLWITLLSVLLPRVVDLSLLPTAPAIVLTYEASLVCFLGIWSLGTGEAFSVLEFARRDRPLGKAAGWVLLPVGAIAFIYYLLLRVVAFGVFAVGQAARSARTVGRSSLEALVSGLPGAATGLPDRSSPALLAAELLRWAKQEDRLVALERALRGDSIAPLAASSADGPAKEATSAALHPPRSADGGGTETETETSGPALVELGEAQEGAAEEGELHARFDRRQLGRLVGAFLHSGTRNQIHEHPGTAQFLGAVAGSWIGRYVHCGKRCGSGKTSQNAFPRPVPVVDQIALQVCGVIGPERST
jgi:hypothetical protein